MYTLGDLHNRRSNDLWRSGSGVCGAERQSLFRPVLAGTDVGTSAEHLYQKCWEKAVIDKDHALTSFLDNQQNKPLRVNMKETVELELLRKFDEIRKFASKEARLTKESMGTLLKSSLG